MPPGMKILLVDDSNTMRRIERITLEKMGWSLPVNMVTSESEKSRIMEALQSGAASYVVKPFQAETLQDKINSVLGKPA